MQNLKRGFGPLVIIIAVAVVLAAGGTAYYTSQNAKKVATDTNVEANIETNVSVESEKKTGTLRDLLAIKKDLMCTIDYADAESTVTGTIFLSGDMMRGDYTMTASSSGTIDSHMIKNGDLVFVWTGSQGMKMDMKALESNTNSNSNANVNLDQKMNYDCNEWSKDSAKFVAPTTINFVDFSALLNAKTNVNVNNLVR